uniref:Uncharacterized protein n=1 Tax=Anguilla anguilla TaxID=7936 RepID=A0A0E9V5N0_ANGAN
MYLTSLIQLVNVVS